MRVSLVVLACARVLAAGCTSPPGDAGLTNQTGQGSPPASTPPAPPVGPAPAATVEVLDNIFQPDRVAIRPGEAVAFVHHGQAEHTVTIARGGQAEAHADRTLQPGQEFVVTFSEPGTYKLRCVPHSSGFDAGMVGRIEVA